MPISQSTFSDIKQKETPQLSSAGTPIGSLVETEEGVLAECPLSRWKLDGEFEVIRLELYLNISWS